MSGSPVNGSVPLWTDFIVEGAEACRPGETPDTDRAVGALRVATGSR
jgi:hypothetical protein